jgi:hypothetical protein
MDLESAVPVLEEGSALIATNAPVQLRVGAYTLLSVGGGYHVTKSGNAVTVAALSAPVLVSVGSLRAAVPAGTQWRIQGETMPRWDAGIAAWMDARKVTSLPRRFAAEQQKALNAIVVHSILPDPQTEAQTFTPAIFPALPEALDRRKEKWIESVLGALRHHVDADDAVKVQQLLLRQDLAEAFSADRAKAVATALLFTTQCSVAMQQQLLPLLLDNPDLWLLLSLHPQVSTVVWTLPAPQHGGEAEAVRLLSFPYADIGDDAGNAVAWDRWEEGLRASVLAAKEPASVAGELIVRLGRLAIDREQEGYPERARSIAHALRALQNTLQESISPETTAVVNELSRLDRVDVRLSAEAASPVAASTAIAESPAFKTSFDLALTESQVRAFLRGAGAAFSLETRIIPVEAHRAHIENIVFAGATHDRTFSMTIDIVNNEISAIREGEEEYPYAMPMGAFLEWIRN